MLHTHYDGMLVCLSLLIAGLSSYAALDLGGRVRVTGGWTSRLWLTAASFALGGGIWAMHFVAMLAFHMPIPVAYDLGLTMISLLLAIGATGIGFAVARRPDTQAGTLVLAGLFMGTGIAAMHYTGMAAMRMSAGLHYRPGLVFLSWLIAVGAATTALRLALRVRSPIRRLAAALCMGCAISGMHYTGMMAAMFEQGGRAGALPPPHLLEQSSLGIAITAATFLILLLALAASAFDRRLTEREAGLLRTSEERFRTLYRHAPLPLHCLDRHDRLTEISEAWLDLLGYQRHAVIGRTMIEFMTEDSARQHQTLIWPQLLRDNQIRDMETQFRRRDGKVLDILLSGQVERDEHGRPIRVLGGLVDITSRKRAEDFARQAQKMEAVGQLTGGVAHDFNNLLAAIIGSLEMANRRVTDPRVTRLLDVAQQAAQRGAKLTSQMLAFARRQDLKMQAFNANDTVVGVQDMLERMIGPLIRVSYDTTGALWPALGDAAQMEVSLINLAVNARDAMPLGGTLTIRTSNVTDPPDLPPGDYVAVACIDSGEGMSASVQAAAFQPFFTTKGPGKGTGLGLSMVHGFASQAGGGAQIVSTPGQGTTVTIYLPRTADPCSTPAMPAPTHCRVGRLSMLLVDDDPGVRTIARDMLEDAGHDVVEADNGRDAIGLLQQQAFDLLVTDFAMPLMTGAALAEEAQKLHPALPVLIVTGFVEGDALRGWAGPGRALLGKPFRTADLEGAVRGLINHDAPSSQNVVQFRAV